VQQAACGTR